MTSTSVRESLHSTGLTIRMSTSTQCVMSANPDICGIGIRISIYVQAFLDLIFTLIAYEHGQLNTTVRTTLITATSLIVAGFIQHSLYGLSLFEAIIIIQLTTIKVAAIIRMSRSVSTFISYTIYLALYVSFVFWVWTDVQNFGSQPECNNYTIFVFFGHNVRTPVGWLRKFTLVFNSFATFATFFQVLAMISTICYVLPRILTYNRLQHRDHIGWPDAINFGQFGSIIYLLVTTEEIMNRNNLPSTVSQWTFGQTLAMFLIVPSLVELATLILEIMKLTRGEDGRRSPDNREDAAN